MSIEKKIEFAEELAIQSRIAKYNSKMTSEMKKFAIEMMPLNSEDFDEKLKEWEEKKREIQEKFPIC
jgi:hypothetical protein